MSTETIVVVSGLPRSGTSLVMRMLGAGGVPLLTDAGRVADESNPHGYFELEAVKASETDASWADAAPGRAVKVIHALLHALPDTQRYDVLLVERDLGEVVASQRAMLARSALEAGPGVPALDDAGDDARLVPALDDAADDALLMDALRRQLDEARHWLAAQPNVRWTPVAHRRLLRDPRTAAAAIARFLDRDRDLDLDAMVACVDPALHRSRHGRS